MNRNRILVFLAALAAVLGLGLVVFFMFQDSGDHRRGPVDVTSTTKTAAPAVEAPRGPAPVTARPSESPGIKPKPFKEGPTYAQDAGIGGVVQNEAGVRIEGALCELYEDMAAIKDRTQEGELREKQTTNSEGLFLFDRNMLSLSERYVLKVIHPLYMTERKAIDVKKPDPVTYVTMKLGTAISGAVRTAAGAPLASATVTVFDMNQGALDPNGSVETYATTDAGGIYTITHVGPGIKKVQASMQGYATMDRQALQLEAGKPLANIDFALNDGTSISGQIMSSEGTPVTAAFVTARPIRIGPRPDQDGVPPGARDIQMSREKEALLREKAQKTVEASGRDRQATEEEEQRKAVAAGDVKGIREAMMQREVSKEPLLRKVASQAQPAQSNTALTVRSQADGSFVIGGTEFGTYMVSVNGPGFIPPPQQTVESPAQGVNFSLAPNARIVGRVIDDETRKPVPMFSVGLTTTPDEVLIPAHTKKPFGPPKFTEGSFEYIDVKPGHYWLVADAPGYAGGRSEEVVVSQGERKQGIEIRLVRGATLKGRVLDATGGPIAGATVQPEPASLTSNGAAGIFLSVMMQNMRRDTREAKTGSDGQFTIPNMLSGSYTLSVKHPDYGPSNTTAFTVQGSGEVLQPDIVLSRGASIKGRVRLADGQPDTKAMVQVSPMGSTPNLAGHRSAYTDADGRFEVTGLAVGQYRVIVAQRNGQPDLGVLFTTLKNPNTVTLAEGEVKELEF